MKINGASAPPHDTDGSYVAGRDKLSAFNTSCGIGRMSRYLTSTLLYTVTGIIISCKQIEIAIKLTQNTIKAVKGIPEAAEDNSFYWLQQGKACFLVVDTETIGYFFRASETDFDSVWVLEALNHFLNKKTFL